MSMHLSKIRVVEKSDKRKWSSAEAKAKAAELEQSWNSLKEKHAKPLGLSNNQTLAKKRLAASSASHLVAGFTPPRGRGPAIPSKGDSSGVATKPESKMYTGTNVMGISIVHKSCLQPVFSEEQAKDFANMRR